MDTTKFFQPQVWQQKWFLFTFGWQKKMSLVFCFQSKCLTLWHKTWQRVRACFQSEGRVFLLESSFKASWVFFLNWGKMMEDVCLRPVKWNSSQDSWCAVVRTKVQTHRDTRNSGNKLTYQGGVCTLFPMIMEVENGCIWKVTTIRGTHFSLPWLFLHHRHHWLSICKCANEYSTFGTTFRPFLPGWFLPLKNLSTQKKNTWQNPTKQQPWMWTADFWGAKKCPQFLWLWPNYKISPT